MNRITCVLTALAASLTLASPSAAVEMTHYRGKTASADIYSIDETGCINSSASVFVAETRYKIPPAPATGGSYAVVYLARYNYCTYELLACANGSVELPSGAYDAQGNLGSAALNLTFDGYDCETGAPVPITVDMTWTGEGDVFTGRSNSSYSYPGYHYSYRSQGKGRSATLNGSVTAVGTTITTTAAPGTFQENYGTLSETQNGSMIRYE